LVQPGDTTVHPATGFQVASVHSIAVSAICASPYGNNDLCPVRF
jgi:hypothetical protein